MKSAPVFVIGIALLIAGFLIFSKNGANAGPTVNANNVTIVNGKQIIEIKVKGGYYPQKSIAKAGIPTVLRFDTKGTFDCSASVRIPSMRISKFLPQTGSTDIDIGTSQATVLRGMCAMGMYPFEIDFQN